MELSKSAEVNQKHPELFCRGIKDEYLAA